MEGSARQWLVDEVRATIRACATEGSGRSVILHGEAGIGKTTIAQLGVRQALDGGVEVWSATASELDQTTPFRLLHSLQAPDGSALFDHDPSRLATSSPAALTDRFGPEVARYAVAEDVIEAIEARAQQPTLVVAEDLHWADPVSLDALAQLTRVALTHPLVLLLTHRDGLADRALDRLRDAASAAGALVAQVPPLSPEEICSLVDRLAGGAASDSVYARASGAAGNPFLVHELVDGLLAEGHPVSPVAGELDDHIDVPRQLRAAVGRELDRLGDDVSNLVRAAAVQGRLIDVRDLAAQLGQTTMQISRPFEAALAAGLLVDRNGSVGFRHDLVRDAVYDQMPAALRVATHRELAEVLSRRDASPALVASHLLLAGGEDPAVVERLRRAAEQTAPLAPETALQFLDRALALIGGDHDTRRVIEHARLEALTAVGRLGEAEGVAHWLLAVSPAAELALLNARLGGLALMGGDSDRARRYVERAIDLAPDDDARARYLGASAVVAATARDYVRAWQLAQQAIDLGTRADSAVGMSIGMALLARMSTYANEVDVGLSMGAKAVALADTDPTGEAHSWVPGLHYGMTAFDVDRFTIAETMVERGVKLAETHRMAWALPLFGTLQAAIHLRRGHLDQAAAEAEAAVAQAQMMQSLHTIAWAQSILALVTLEVGTVAEARTWLEAADASWTSGRSSLGVNFLALARARVTVAEGDAAGALDGLRSEWEQLEGEGLAFCHPLLAVDLWKLARALGDDKWAERAVVALESAAAANHVLADAATAQWMRAVHAGDGPGVRAALDRLRLTERQLDVARCLAHAPELASVSRSGGAATAEREALALFAASGAGASAAAVETALAGAGAPTTQASDPWDQLTPTELAIAELLAEGLTNAEIARRRNSSRRTIESHLSRVYRKLGIDGRVKLTVAAAERFRTTPSTPSP